MHIYSKFNWNSLITYPKRTLTHAKKEIFVILKTNLRYPFYILTLTSFQVWLQLVCHRKTPLVLSRCQGSFLLSRSYSLFSQSDHPASFVEVLKNNKCFTTALGNESKENNWYAMLTKAKFNCLILQLIFIPYHISLAFLCFFVKMRMMQSNNKNDNCPVESFFVGNNTHLEKSFTNQGSYFSQCMHFLSSLCPFLPNSHHIGNYNKQTAN